MLNSSIVLIKSIKIILPLHRGLLGSFCRYGKQKDIPIVKELVETHNIRQIIWVLIGLEGIPVDYDSKSLLLFLNCRSPGLVLEAKYFIYYSQHMIISTPIPIILTRGFNKRVPYPSAAEVCTRSEECVIA